MASNTKVEFDVLANDKASKKLDKLADTFTHIGRAATKGGNEASKGMGKITQGAGQALKGLAKLPALAAGTAVGVAFIGGLSAAMAKQDANAKLAASLGLTKPESAKIGKIAGDLYKNAYGESVGEVSDVLTTVFQAGLVNAKSSETAIKRVSEQVLNYSKISGEQALPVTRAVAQMLRNGLAKNAEEAFDVLTRGQQLGINKSEDLLDTFNEYGTQFRKIGLDGPAALGLMNQALQAGARDSDTAADALKEFAIRAVDGSESTKDAFKSLGLSASGMQKVFAEGGPKAAAGLNTVLDKLRAVKEPAERSRIAVELFGTKAEDLGDALYAFDPSTAVTGLGQLEGAAQRAGDTLNDTASVKLTQVIRTIKGTLVDALGKYALPKLEEFADWFNGPGKFVLVSWALQGGSAILGLADKMLGAIQGMVGGLAKFGRIAMIAAAGVVAMFNPGMAVDMIKNANALGQWAEEAQSGIGDARLELQGWKNQLDKTNTKVKLQADIANLESKLATAKRQLGDKNLTKERKAKLNAEIKDLESKIRTAKDKLNGTDLTKTRTAKLTATIGELQRQINAGKQKLSDPKLTATQRAKLSATIGELQRQVNAAKTKLNELKNKTITVTMTTRNIQIVQRQYQNVISGQYDYYGNPISGARASGGPVQAGRAYLVGEQRPEVFVPNEDGYVVPSVEQLGRMANGWGGRGGQPIVIQSGGSRMDDLLVEILAKAIRNKGGDVVGVLSGGGRR